MIKGKRASWAAVVLLALACGGRAQVLAGPTGAGGSVAMAGASTAGAAAGGGPIAGGPTSGGAPGVTGGGSTSASGSAGEAGSAGYIDYSLLCIPSDHWDSTLCECVPNRPRDPGAPSDGGPCLDIADCVLGTHWDSVACKCAQNECSKSTDCKGPLPNYCVSLCADGTSACSHFECISGACTVATCTPFRVGQSCGPGATCPGGYTCKPALDGGPGYGCVPVPSPPSM